MATDQIVQRRAGPAIGDQRGLRADLFGEQQAGHMRGRTDAAMGLFHSVALLPEHGNEFLQVLRREILSRDHDGRRMRGDADRHEVGEGIVLDVGREHRGCHMRAHGRREQGVAVRGGGGRPRAADGAARAADILDNDGLPENLGHLVGDDPRDHIAGAARGEGDDHGDRPGRIVLRAQRSDAGGDSDQNDAHDDNGRPDADPWSHDAFSSAPMTTRRGLALTTFALPQPARASP
jgi:hypothetical protein